MDKSILVIDDSPFAAQQIREVVEEHGYHVVGCARNGEEGIEQYKKLKPKFVILDIIMPGIDGLETAEILLKENENVKILMLSSLCDAETIEEVKSIGVKYLIPKPLEPEVFMATLELLNKKDQ